MCGSLCVQLNPETLRSLKWTIVKAVMSLLFSSLGVVIIHLLSDYSLFVKHTRNEASTITKIALFQIINSFLVPLVAFVVSGNDPYRLWCALSLSGIVAAAARVSSMFHKVTITLQGRP
jgi:drug/metabolite transporter (DMT)-like permease